MKGLRDKMKKHRNSLDDYIGQGVELTAVYQRKYDPFCGKIKPDKLIYFSMQNNNAVAIIPGDDPPVQPLIEFSCEGYVFVEVRGIDGFDSIKENHIIIFSANDYLQDEIKPGDKVKISGFVETYSSGNKSGGYDNRIKVFSMIKISK